MKEQTFDYIFIGKNLSSILYSSFIASNKKILILSDQRIKSAPQFRQFLSYDEVLLLNDIISEKKLERIVSFNNYISPMTNNILIKGRNLVLTKNIFNNLVEIKRCLPVSLNVNSEYNYITEYEKLINLIISFIKIPKKRRHWSKILNKFDSSSELNQVIHKLVKLFDDEVFSYEVQLIYSDKVEYNLSYVQKYFLILKLIGPCFYFDEEAFVNAFNGEQGEAKDGLIESWQFKSSETELLLKSYEGVIKAKKVIFCESLSNQVPFKIDSRSKIYKTFSYLLTFNEAIPEMKGHRFVNLYPDNYLNDLPMSELFFPTEGTAIITFFILDMEGSIIDFYEKKFEMIIEDFLLRYNLKTKYFRKTFIEMNYRIIDFNENFESKKIIDYKSGRINYINVMEVITPLKMHKLHDFNFWGDFQGKYLGNFSHYWEAKEVFSKW